MRQIHDVWGVADGWQRAALIALAAATLLQTLFIYNYARRPWWRDEVGRAIMLKSTTLGVVLWVSLVNNFFVYRWSEQVGTIALVLVTIGISYQLVALLRTPSRIPPDPDPELVEQPQPSR